MLANQASAAFSDAALPVPPQPGRLVVIAPHPDDETLGAGGVLHDLGARGWVTEVVVVSDGSESHPGLPGLTSLRQAECRQACAHLGVDTLRFLSFPDGALSEIVDKVAVALALLLDGVDVVIGPLGNDGHDDHRACARALDVALCLIVPTPIRWSYGVWAWDVERFGDPDLTSARVFTVSTDGRRARRAAVREYVSQCTDRYGAPVVPEQLVQRICEADEVFW